MSSIRSDKVIRGCYRDMVKVAQAQPGLFDSGPAPDDTEAAAARNRMFGMVDRLNRAEVAAWKDQMAVILDDGAFQRAMRLVPADEAQALWAEFDALMERQYAVWSKTQTALKS